MTATRDRLLDAALRAFATKGVDGTAITDLEAAAGLAAGSGGFYRYFRTKEEILAATVEREIERIEAQGRLPAADMPTSGRAAVAAQVELALETLSAHRELIAILTRERGRIPELAARIRSSLVDGGVRQDADLLRAATADGDGDDRDLTRRGAILISAVVGYHLAREYFGAAPGGLEPKELAATLADLLTDT